jgi:5-methylcytosine-specific restriction endonuclease McrA
MLKPIYKFSRPYVINPNPQGYVYRSFVDVGIDLESRRSDSIYEETQGRNRVNRIDSVGVKRVITPVTTADVRKFKKFEADEVELVILENEVQPEFEYTPAPEPKIDYSRKTSSKSLHVRSELKKANALIRACYSCEFESKHKSFLSRKTNKPYMETHHLIPLEYWDSFDNSLDVEANITCLCSNCHNEIHYGKEAHRIIETLYKKRSEELYDAGIYVSLEQLLAMYDGDYVIDSSN